MIFLNLYQRASTGTVFFDDLKITQSTQTLCAIGIPIGQKDDDYLPMDRDRLFGLS